MPPKNIRSSKNKGNKTWKKFIKFLSWIRNEYSISKILLDPNLLWLIAIILFIAEFVLNVIVIESVPYTNIDWNAYMEQVGSVLNGTYDYAQLKGDTGPLVYPGGYVMVFSLLYKLTNSGTCIYCAQYIFMAIYLINLLLVFAIYYKASKVPPFALIFMCCTSYRIHSIYVLRLFNDPVAMLFLYAAVWFFINHRWSLGCLFYSFAVSIKMNVLLFSPGLFVLLLYSGGILGALKNISLCALVQLLTGLPFLLSNPVGYISRAFNLGRIFLFEWTVNWRFLPEDVFVNPYFHLSLLALHLLTLLIFYRKWMKNMHMSQWIPTKPYEEKLSVNQILLPLLESNFIGMVFSRSLHYQFYVWYFHGLHYLLWSTRLSTIFRLSILGLIELCWNIFPSTVFSSVMLHVCHIFLLLALGMESSSYTTISLSKSKPTKLKQ